MPKARKNYQLFSISFRDTKLAWYTSMLNETLIRFGGRVLCFYSGHGDNLLVFLAKGDPNSQKRLVMPKAKEDYLKLRGADLDKKSASIDPFSIKESAKGNSYSLDYGGAEKIGKDDYLFYEHVVFFGDDQIVFQGVSPKASDPIIIEDMKIISGSFRLNKKLKTKVIRAENIS